MYNGMELNAQSFSISLLPNSKRMVADSFSKLKEPTTNKKEADYSHSSFPFQYLISLHFYGFPFHLSFYLFLFFTPTFVNRNINTKLNQWTY